MRKHIYVHTSDLECIRQLRDSDEFEHTWRYPEYELTNTQKNEYGRIKTDNFFIHLLLGQILQPNCPWCDTPPVLTKVIGYEIIRRTVYCLGCPKCGARGPTLNIDYCLEESKEMMNEVESLLKAKFIRRIPWDENLQKEYTNVDS